MPDDGYVDLGFPLAGVHLGWAFGQQPNLPVGDGRYSRTTPVGENVRAFDPTTDRARGASRSGIVKHLQAQVAGTNAIQEIASVVQTEGTIPGTGQVTTPYAGYIGRFLSPTGTLTTARLGTFAPAAGLRYLPAENTTYPYIVNSVSAKSFLSGAPNTSFTSIGIPDSTPVTVSVCLRSDSASGQLTYYETIVNDRIGVAATALPYGGYPGRFSLCSDATYHYVVGVTGTAVPYDLGVTAISQAGAVGWTKADVIDIGYAADFVENPQLSLQCCSAVTATYIVAWLPQNKLYRCAVADGTSGAVVKTKAQIEAQAGTGYTTPVIANNLQHLAVAQSGTIAAVTVNKRSQVDGVYTNYSGLVFVTIATGAFPYAALTGVTTSTAVTGPVNTSTATVISDGTDFYMCVSLGNYDQEFGFPSGNSVIKKVNGATGAVIWTTEVCPLSAGQLRMAYLTGTARLEVYGTNTSLSINATTGAIVGAGLLPGGNDVKAVANGGSVTTGAQTVGNDLATGPTNVLVAVSNGTVKVAADGGWQTVTNGASALAAFTVTPVIRSTTLFGKIYFADGVNAKLYDPVANEIQAWVATQGSLPQDSNGGRPRLICTWRNRIMMSGLPLDPHKIFGTAVDDANNLDYAPSVFLSTTAFVRNNRDVVTGLIPYSNDVLIIGGDHTLYMLRGDPAAGGEIDLISDLMGMAWGKAWCKDPSGNLYFFSNGTGIYVMRPGSQPVRMSQQIERILSQVDLSVTTVRLVWNDRFQGMHVFLTPHEQATATRHLFWEQRTNAWWTDTFANINHSPLCVHNYEGSGIATQMLLIGSWDGYVRQYSPGATTDDGTDIESRVLIGPLTSPTMDDWLCEELQMILGQNSSAVNFGLLVGNTPESAAGSTAVYTGTFPAGRSLTHRPRRAGHAIYVDINSAGSWAMEGCRMRAKGYGRTRQRGR